MSCPESPNPYLPNEGSSILISQDFKHILRLKHTMTEEGQGEEPTRAGGVEKHRLLHAAANPRVLRQRAITLHFCLAPILLLLRHARP